tara:strand:- start:624 stop:830 length:207 start_codon:yes stop_codon:yes gene_type:complete
VSCGKGIKLNMDVRTAAAVRESLFRDTKIYTYDPSCCPPRVVELRTVIVDLDEQIEELLKSHVEDDTQ